MTERRRAVAVAADGFGRAFTVEDLVNAARAHSPGIGQATVYRAVAAMETTGALERVGTRDDSALYVRCSADEHHHHLVCTACSAVAHAACPLDPVFPGESASRDGFVVTSHEITLYGLCPECAGRPGPQDTIDSGKD